MTLPNAAAIALLLLLATHGSSKPHPPPNPQILPDTAISNPHMYSHPPYSPSPTHHNHTAPPRNFHISCFASGNETITVDSCRPTLNSFRVFPDYRLVQPFREHKYPRQQPPPLTLHHRDANCAVQIAAQNMLVEDTFSWNQIRATATDIVADCVDKGAWGGWSPVGNGVGFRVRVFEFHDGEGVGWGGLGAGVDEVGDGSSLPA